MIKLLFGNSENNSEILYITEKRNHADLAAISFNDDSWTIITNKLDCNSINNQLLQISEVRTFGKEGLIKATVDELKKNNIKDLLILDSTPVKIYQSLLNEKFNVETMQSMNDRTIKGQFGISQITRAQTAATSAMDLARNIIANCSVDSNKRLIHNNDILTSEILRIEINSHLLTHNAFAETIIASCGIASSDPHDEGAGPIFSNQPILLDIFPRLLDTGYWGDLSRTFCKGQPSQRLIDMHKAVLEAQEAGLMAIKTMDFMAVDKATRDVIDSAGFKTKDMVGYCHGVGHGVGLDVHELPFPSKTPELEPGNAITVEPGLYYPNIGGVRIEDTVLVTDLGFEYFSETDKGLVID